MSDHLRLLLKKRQVRLLRKQKRKANEGRNNKNNVDISYAGNYKRYQRLVKIRQSSYKRIFRRTYRKKPIAVEIAGEFGIEEDGGIDYFLDRASTIIDFNNRSLTIDLAECTRVWPSAITLMCSMLQWVELATQSGTRPVLASTPSRNDKVNSYLNHSGFYKYVDRPPDITKHNYYSDSDIVKIRRESSPEEIEAREDEIVALCQQYSDLDAESIERFNGIILTEAFANVTEHGLSYRDNGWWLLAQYHKTHGIISLCMADNGIGIRTSLMTGPQAADIASDISDRPENDGDFIKLALEKNVSGALMAPLKTAGGFLRSKKYEKGSHRGNGLRRITDTCKKLGIPFAILSHYGYAFQNARGDIIKYGAKPHRVFAGTLYHFVIPARKEQ